MPKSRCSAVVGDAHRLEDERARDRPAAPSASGMCTVSGTTRSSSRGEHHHRAEALARRSGARRARRGTRCGRDRGSRRCTSTCLAIGLVTSAAASPRDDRGRRRLDGRDDGGGVGGIGLAGPRRRARAATGATGSAVAKTSARLGRRGDGARAAPQGRAARARSATASGSAKSTNGSSAVVAALAPGLERDLEPDAGRVAHGDGERQAAAGCRASGPISGTRCGRPGADPSGASWTGSRTPSGAARSRRSRASLLGLDDLAPAHGPQLDAALADGGRQHLAVAGVEQQAARRLGDARRPAVAEVVEAGAGDAGASVRRCSCSR